MIAHRISALATLAGMIPLLMPLNPAQAQANAAKGFVISGSSTVFPFSRAAIASLNKAGRGAITAEASGTSAGLRQFCAGNSLLAAASRPINAKELKACRDKGVAFLELPLAFDAITVVVNSTNSFARQISTEQLKLLWSSDAEGKVTRWRQVNPSWPDRAIKLCGPGKESGTYDTFNKAINGSESNSRQDYTASEDDTVLVRCVASDPSALGYFGFDYYQANRSKLRALAVQGPRGPILPSLKSVQSSQYVPLSRPLFYYVNAAEVQTNPLLRSFIDHTLQRGRRIASQAGLIPLQESTYRLVTNKLYRNVQGTAFDGSLPIGLTVGQILQRSFDAQKQPQFR